MSEKIKEEFIHGARIVWFIDVKELEQYTAFHAHQRGDSLYITAKRIKDRKVVKLFSMAWSGSDGKHL